MRLNGKVAIITGAGQGLGLSIAELFAQEGARLVLNDLKKPRSRASRQTHDLVPGDVSTPRVARRLITAAINRYGRIDILVNNAGIGGSSRGDGPVTESREDSWDRILRVNLKSVFLCCRYAIPEMIRGGGG
ncbi:MAG TPA: SDR family NAD(P)-dependent oxidoreductase, partial [Terriglobia bacterium]|nr:SDR family NAD(P)-dependent oxidoreductase [Terriglobia bacterium]